MSSSSASMSALGLTGRTALASSSSGSEGGTRTPVDREHPAVVAGRVGDGAELQPEHPSPRPEIARVLGEQLHQQLGAGK